MIAKGTFHNNGNKLAAYLITGKEGERAELWKMRGFASGDIREAFRSVDQMADGTRCTQPFFHVQVRNPEGEEVTRAQWERIANRIESKLGLTGQPRAIAFHTNEKTGHEHMHVAWSRIDPDTLKARPVRFFKLRLKEVSRELEKELGLTRVKNEREGPLKYAPTRAQEEQARRLGVDIHEVRNTIRHCWGRSDCGRSFEAALAHEGLTLAQGDRRGFVVIDDRGGLHVLSKRILDVPAAKIRDRLSDLDRDQLPTVEQARASIRGLSCDRQQKQPEPAWDRDRDDKIWHDAVTKAAIEKDKTERRFIDPEKKRAERAGSREEKKWPAMPPRTYRTDPMTFERAAREAERDKRPENLKGMGARIWEVWRQSHTSKALDAEIVWPNPRQSYRIDAKAFAAALDEKGIGFARVTKQEAERSHREAEFAKAVGNYAPRFKEGEIVAVTAQRPEYRRNGEIIEPRRVHKLDQSLARKFVAALDSGSKLQGIDATKQALNERAQQRSAEWQAIRLENATKKRGAAPIRAGKLRIPSIVAKVPLREIGKTLDLVGNVFESLLAPKLTPEQVRQGERARQKREAEAEHSIDFSKYTTLRAQERQQQDNEREAERRQHRGRGGGGRER